MLAYGHWCLWSAGHPLRLRVFRTKVARELNHVPKDLGYKFNKIAEMVLRCDMYLSYTLSRAYLYWRYRYPEVSYIIRYWG